MSNEKKILKAEKDWRRESVNTPEPAHEQTRRDAAKLGIELPPLPDWARKHIDPEDQSGLAKMDLKGLRKMPFELRELICEYPQGALVWSTQAEQYGFLNQAEVRQVASSLCLKDGSNPKAWVLLLTVIFPDEAGKPRVAATISERVKIVGYHAGLTPENLRLALLTEAEA